ncbi:MAG: hypothetical protein LUD22_01055 [Coprobacillus sp.]|nr:hypothetical protein [Coprobacillus sp.]
MKTLIVYFSRGGHTRVAATKLSLRENDDLFEIKTDVKYGGYLKAIFVARKEFKNNTLPNILEDVPDFESYDRILLGFPVWYGKCPQVVISFLNKHDCTGKDVYPFFTSGTSPMTNAIPQLQEACRGATLHEGIRLAKYDEDAVTKWLNN